MSALTTVILAAGIFSLYAWVASLITGDTSQVDRLWSIVPAVYMWIFYFRSPHGNSVLLVMTILVTLWGARLTFNFARKGGYSGVEDYRWAVLRGGMTRWQFQLFNFFFIVLYQNFILVLITVPAVLVGESSSTLFRTGDWCLAILFIALLVGEFVADQQQWDFHQSKKKIIESGGAPNPMFLQTGLFKYSRHPNYFFEIAQWWVIYIFGAYSVHRFFSWQIVGALLLTLLFVGSTRFTEQISASKYPEYKEFQRRTSPIIPWFPRR